MAQNPRRLTRFVITCVHRFDDSSSRRCAWKTTNLPLENHGTGLCQGKLIENKTLSLFNDREWFFKDTKEVFFVFNYSFVVTLDRPLIGIKRSNPLKAYEVTRWSQLRLQRE